MGGLCHQPGAKKRGQKAYQNENQQGSIEFFDHGLFGHEFESFISPGADGVPIAEV